MSQTRVGQKSARFVLFCVLFCVQFEIVIENLYQVDVEVLILLIFQHFWYYSFGHVSKLFAGY